MAEPVVSFLLDSKFSAHLLFCTLYTFSYLVHSLLPRDNLFKNIFVKWVQSFTKTLNLHF